MCVICISPKGQRQPTDGELKKMWNKNPDGAGYMVARDGNVLFHKGFMFWENYIEQIHLEHFTSEDVVCYHFRISTQAGVNPYMCHPFGITKYYRATAVLDGYTGLGIMHNGIIRLTTDPKEKEYSDTALFIVKYLTKLVRNPADIHNKEIKIMIEELTNSKWAFLLPDGSIETVGHFTSVNGILCSNDYWTGKAKKQFTPRYVNSYGWDDETMDNPADFPEWWFK